MIKLITRSRKLSHKIAAPVAAPILMKKFISIKIPAANLKNWFFDFLAQTSIERIKLIAPCDAYKCNC